MNRETFAGRLREAAAKCVAFSQQYLEERLPAEIRFRLRLNQSYDGNPLVADEVVFPKDSAPERTRALRSCSADDVISALWRAERVPEWVNLNVAGMTPTTTIIEILACGRFTSNDEFLYHIPAGLPPFQVGGPTLPLEWVEGQRFSIHYHSKCASPDELEAMRPHGAKPWSLDLEGAVATDDTLLALPDLPNLEILELHDSKLRGPGLSALARFPKLRILRVHGVDDAVDVSDGPKLKRLDEVTMAGLPPRPCGIEAWADRLPALVRLSLTATGNLHLAAALPKRLDHLTLTGARLTGETRFPKRVAWLSLHLAQQDPAALEALLAPTRHVESLWLRGTPVGDDLVAKLLSRWKLDYLDVVDTTVTQAFLRRLALERPALRMHPVPDLSDITPEQIKQRVELQLSRPLRFTSFHGIEPDNLRAALVEPTPVMVTRRGDPSTQRQMWAILKETDGHLVLFDPQNGCWVVAKRGPDGWLEQTVGQGLDQMLSVYDRFTPRPPRS